LERVESQSVVKGDATSRRKEQARISRYWEIDALRGLAIIWMIGFHLTWDLVLYGRVQINMSRGPWPWFSRIIATTFLTLVGISLVISYSRRGARSSGLGGAIPPGGFRKYLIRGAKVFGLGLVITLVTYFALGDGFVVFGILHLIGFSIVAAYPFLPYRRRWVSLLTGLALLFAGSYLNRQTALTPWFIWLGVNELGRPMADWYPVLPWFGMVLIGIWIGHMLYTGGQRQFSLPDQPRTPVVRGLAYLGRHALLIYMVHQPVLMGILLAVDWLAPT
jgi:uncharacterized membrane protein